VARTGRRALWSVVAVLTALSTVQLFQEIGDLDAIGPILANLFYVPLIAIFLDIFALTPLAQRVVGRAADQGVADQIIGAAAPLGKTSTAAHRARRPTHEQIQ
jgi:hypothetical protein